MVIFNQQWHIYDHTIHVLNTICPYFGNKAHLAQLLPSGNVKIAIENGPVEIVDFPNKKWWIFP